MGYLCLAACVTVLQSFLGTELISKVEELLSVSRPSRDDPFLLLCFKGFFMHVLHIFRVIMMIRIIMGILLVPISEQRFLRLCPMILTSLEQAELMKPSGTFILSLRVPMLMKISADVCGCVDNGSCLLLSQCADAKKYCWYFEGGYPIYFMYVQHYWYESTCPDTLLVMVDEPISRQTRSAQMFDHVKSSGCSPDLSQARLYGGHFMPKPCKWSQRVFQL